jgi:pilus assembly protein CpaB
LFQAGGTPVRNWRVLTAVAAVVLAAVASVLAYSYLTQADARAQDKTELVPVLVAKQTIPKGTPAASAATSDLLGVKKVPRNVLPDGALTDDTSLKGLVASAAIDKGQFVVKDSFVAPSQVDGFSNTVQGGKQAISLTVDMTHGVAGFIQPNDSVNAIVTIDITDKINNTGSLKTTAFLIPGLRVLAVGSTTAGTSAPAPQSTTGDTTATTQAPQQQQGLITVEVTPRQAEQIAQAMAAGQITLTLNPPNFDASKFQTPEEIVDAFNLFDQPMSKLQSIEQQIKSAK